MTGRRPTSVLIAGAGIAGPALAFWLHRHGFDVTVVERAPGLREGGQAIDIRGVAKDVVGRMGLTERVRAGCTETRAITWVDARNRPEVTLRADAFGGDGIVAEIEILRGDLAGILYEATAEGVDYRFGERITGLRDSGDGVEVWFESGPPGRFDLVVGADGLHSATRGLVFGPEERFVRRLGPHLCFFTAANHLNLDRWWVGYAEPGGLSSSLRSVRNNSEAMAMFSFFDQELDYDHRDVAAQKAIVRERVSGMAWETPVLLEQMEGASDFFLDFCGQTRMDSWSRGRVVLLGDSAFCPSPTSGQGTSLALVGAYVLAGELAARADHRAAFAAYEEVLRDYVAANQRLGVEGAKRFRRRGRISLWAWYRAVELLAWLPDRVSTRMMAYSAREPDLPSYGEVPASA